MKFVAIETERLSIRCLHSGDSIALSGYRSKSEVARFQSWQDYSISQANDLIDEMKNSTPDVKGKWYQFGIELINSGKLIGDIGFLNTDEHGQCWLGFTLDSKYWNQGFAKEAVQAVLTYYSSLGVSAVWASTDPSNTSSKKLLEKLGFVLVENTPDESVFKKN